MSRHVLWERPFARELPDTAVDAGAASSRLLPGVCIAALDDGPSSRLHQIARYTANPMAEPMTTPTSALASCRPVAARATGVTNFESDRRGAYLAQDAASIEFPTLPERWSRGTRTV